jgi:polyhydroxyalkanoate synthase
VRKYQNHPVTRHTTHQPIIWQSGSTVVRDYNPGKPKAPVVLVVPSLINRFDILDLEPDHSFLRSLAAAGFRPFVVDWGRPSEDEKDFTLNHYITKKLQPILDELPPHVHLIGYCMGGNLALALAQLNQNRFKTLSLLATPWDFHQPNQMINSHFQWLANNLEKYLSISGYLPTDIIQSLFTTLQPFNTLIKFMNFADADTDSDQVRRFVLLEDWLNDGVPLTAPVARECLYDWYGRNTPANGQWTVDGQSINPRHITLPSFVVVPGKDRIVPPESALPLARALLHSTLHEPMTGHIGLMASKEAPHRVWKPLFTWLTEHN